MTAPAGPDPRELSLMLADDIERVCEALNLDVARRSRRTLYCHSPRVTASSPKLEVEIWPKAGKWNDWVAGKYGDALGLVVYALFSDNPKDRHAVGKAIGWAKEYFGLAAVDAEAWRRRREEAEARAKTREAAARRELNASRKTAKGLWLAAEALAPGTAGWDYLLARGIDLAQLPRLPRAVKYSTAHKWHDETGAVRHVGPALLSAMTLPNGDFASLHQIWINPERAGEKADLSEISDRAPARKMWPSSEGAAIRLWRGETGLSERDAAAQQITEDIVVCEGVEDGLSIALMTPELRVHAAGSLPGLDSYQPPKFVRRVIVAADNDWGKPQAAALLERACARLSEMGKAVAIARSPEGKDFNDLLKGRA
jgi:hypothetical protein